MLGFITETDLGQADEVFPGIEQFFDSLAEKPRTFLELVSQFEHWTSRRHAAQRRVGATAHGGAMGDRL
jgi:hypothetical protein